MEEKNEQTEQPVKKESTNGALFSFVANKQNDIGVKKVLNVFADIANGKYDAEFAAHQKASKK